MEKVSNMRQPRDLLSDKGAYQYNEGQMNWWSLASQGHIREKSMPLELAKLKTYSSVAEEFLR